MRVGTSDPLKIPSSLGLLLAIGLVAMLSLGSVSVTSAAGPGDPTILSIDVSSITENSATVAWTLDEPSSGKVKYGTKDKYGDSTQEVTDLETSHSQELTGLEPDTTYHYRVVSTDATGATVKSADRVFTTALDGAPSDPDPDGVPTILSIDVSSPTKSWATVSWTLDEPASGKIRFGKTDKYGDSTQKAKDLDTSHAQVLSGLQPDTKYHYQVVSTDASGETVRSADRVFTTALADAPPTPPQDGEAVLVGAGDIAKCGATDDEATAALLDEISGTVFTTGDNAYNDGSRRQFRRCFDPSWGEHQSRIRPSTGNHEYYVSGAKGYFVYFGSAAGQSGEGYYSYDLGSWHIVVLNSNCDEIGGCDKDSAQGQWLKQDLKENDVACTLAYWHHPLFSSGDHGPQKEMRPFWRLLYAAGADVVLGGHDHDYERFDLQDPAGNLDRDHGIRQFVVGTGGATLERFQTEAANSQVRHDKSAGVLKLTLRDGSYDWEFVPVAGSSFTDRGSGDCVAAA